MRSPRIEFAVGAFLLLAIATLLVLAIASTNGRWASGGDGYLLKARFSNIGALRPNAPVKIGGVAIGRVADIQLDPTKLDAVVMMSIEGTYDELPSDTAAGIFTAGLLGESYIGLTPGGDPEPLKPGDELYLTQPSVDLLQLVGKYMFSGAGKSDEDAPADDGDAAAPTE